MKIQNNIQNPNFQGCKNLIFEDFNTDKIRITYLGAQLTDDVDKDLTALREALKNSNVKEAHNLNSDVMTLISVAIPETKKHYMCFNGEILSTGQELKNYETQVKNLGLCEQNAFAKEKIFSLKAYSLAANITKKIASTSLMNKDAGIANVATTLFRNFQNIFDKTVNAETLLHMGFFNKKEPQQIAILFNEYIKKTMKVYFK